MVIVIVRTEWAPEPSPVFKEPCDSVFLSLSSLFCAALISIKVFTVT